MKTKMIVLLSLVFVLLLAVPVSAAPPVVYTGEIDEAFPIVFEDGSGPCPDFPVYDHNVGTWRFTEYYDNDGVLLKTILHVSGTDNLTNPRNPGVVLSGHYAGTEIYNVRTGEWMAPGTFWSITAPGYGTVLKEAGLYKTANGRLVGIHTSYDPAKMEVLCALLRAN